MLQATRRSFGQHEEFSGDSPARCSCHQAGPVLVELFYEMGRRRAPTYSDADIAIAVIYVAIFLALRGAWSSFGVGVGEIFAIYCARRRTPLLEAIWVLGILKA